MERSLKNFAKLMKLPYGTANIPIQGLAWITLIPSKALAAKPLNETPEKIRENSRNKVRRENVSSRQKVACLNVFISFAKFPFETKKHNPLKEDCKNIWEHAHITSLRISYLCLYP